MHLVPRYRQKLAHVPYGQGRPVWVDDPHFNARYHVRHSALPSPGLRRAAAQPRRGACSPSRWTGPSRCGSSTSSRGSRATASRSSPRPIMRSWTASAASTSPRCSSTSRPTPRRRRPRAASGCRVRSRPTPSCWPRRCWSARRCRPRAPAGCARSRARRARSSGRRANGSSASARWRGRGSARAAVALQRADRPAPALHVGRLRGRALQGDQERPGRHAQRRRAVGGRRWRSGASCAAAAIETDGLVLKAMVPVSVRADDAARRAGQPRRRHVGAAARGRDRPRGGAVARSPRRCAGSRSPGRPSAPWR